MKYWQTEIDAQKIIWLKIDFPLKSQNLLNLDALTELDQIIEMVRLHPEIKALVITSNKENSFIAGADIVYFKSLTTWDERLNFIRLGQCVFDKLAQLTIPTIALIDGHCLGAGLELALACQYRIGIENSQGLIGLPEVRLGIISIWGGISRLTKLIGAFKAMPLMMRGTLLNFESAKKIGLFDLYIPKRLARTAIDEYGLKPYKKRLSYYHWSNFAIFRNILAQLFHYQLVKANVNKNHYPAPYKVVELFAKITNLDEIHAMHYLVETHSTAKNLVRVFFLGEQLKKKIAHSTIGTKIQHVHIIGAGKMGGSIAALCVLKGIKVTLQDKNANLMAAAFYRAIQLFKKKLNHPRAVQKVSDLLIPDDGAGIKKADVIIEAVNENKIDKNHLFVRTIEPYARPDAILATNTSSIDLTKISSEMKNPERLLGLHFFDPVMKMKLVEVVYTESSEEQLIQQAIAFIQQIDRLPLQVKNSSGFLVNRMLWPYLLESVQLYEEGVSPYLIDKAAENFGMPIGPLELADGLGLDICGEVLKNLNQSFGGVAPSKLSSLIKHGDLGKKTGKGFYQYRNNKPLKQLNMMHTVGEEAIIQRIIVRMLNEACACLEQGIVANSDLLDSALIFGIGFAPFRGGLIQYAKTLGEAELKSMFQALQHQYGQRFKPHTHWQKWLV